MTRTTHRLALTAGMLALVVSAAACAPSTDAQAEPDPAAALTLADGWVKAAESGMTATFGTLTNGTDAAITLVGVECDLSPAEIHEVVMDDDGAMVMRPKEGGLVVPAHGTAELAPGADHLMLLDLAAPVAAGDEVSLTLVADDGTTWTVTATGRTFDGAAEDYQPGEEGMAGMDGETDEP